MVFGMYRLELHSGDPANLTYLNVAPYAPGIATAGLAMGGVTHLLAKSVVCRLFSH
jgi:hypothetical protein